MSLVGLTEQLSLRGELGKMAEAEDFKELGNTAFKEKKYEEAVQHYTHAIDRNPMEPIFLVNRAAAYLQMKRHAPCIQDCFQAINRRYTADMGVSSKAYYRLGIAQAALREWEDAYASLESSLMCHYNERVAKKLSEIEKHLPVDPLLVINPVRRKLNDRGWSHFSLGNTCSVSTVKGLPLDTFISSVGTDAVRLLYLGVGDVRNVLTTVKDFLDRHPADASVPTNLHLHLNDIAASTLARDVVLLLLAADGEFSTFISVWANALLSPREREVLRAYLDRLLRWTEPMNSTTLPQWLHLNGHPSSLRQMRSMWSHWRHCTLTHREVHPIRQKALSMKIPRHPREHQLWQAYGLGYFSEGIPEFFSELNSWPANPTLLDPVTLEFLEVQGPFQCFNGLRDGIPQLSQSLYAAWVPLLEAFQQALQQNAQLRLEVHFWQGHCIRVMEKEMPQTLQFDVIDTSNLMDYFGLWNTVLPSISKLRTGSSVAFAQLQNVFGSGGSYLDVLQKHGLVRQPEKLLALIGCKCSAVEQTRGSSTLMRFFLDPDAARRLQLTAEVAAETLSELYFCTCNPIPLPVTDDPLRKPFMTGWFLQSQTGLTMVKCLERMQKIYEEHLQGADNDLDDLETMDQYSYEVPEIVPGLAPLILVNQPFTNGLGAQNRLLSLCTALALRVDKMGVTIGDLNSSLRELTGSLGIYRGFVKPRYDLGGMRGGIFEPSLAVALVGKKADVEEGRKLTGKMRDEDTHHGIPFLQWLGHKSQSDIQVVDNVGFNVYSNQLSFVFPSPDRAKPPNATGDPMCAMHWVVLVDVQRCEMIAEPMSLSAFQWTRL